MLWTQRTSSEDRWLGRTHTQYRKTTTPCRVVFWSFPRPFFTAFHRTYGPYQSLKGLFRRVNWAPHEHEAWCPSASGPRARPSAPVYGSPSDTPVPSMRLVQPVASRPRVMALSVVCSMGRYVAE
jgi:hypothetical protein